MCAKDGIGNVVLVVVDVVAAVDAPVVDALAGAASAVGTEQASTALRAAETQRRTPFLLWGRR
jgi:hypothetical protein